MVGRALGKFKYYTIYRCSTCGKRIRVHGKLTSQLVLPKGVSMCCKLPRLKRERHVLISKYKEEQEGELADKPSTQQKSLFE